MEKERGSRGKLIEQILKAYENDPLISQKYDISNSDISRTF